MEVSVSEIIESSFDFKPIVTQKLGGYSGRVWEIEDESQAKFVVKVLKDQSTKDILHHHAEVAFAKALNASGIAQSVKFIPNSQGETLIPLAPNSDDYLVMMECHPIVHKIQLTATEQQDLGRVMESVHNVLADFEHPGLGTTAYMRQASPKGWEIIKAAFSAQELKPYLPLMQPLDYAALGIHTGAIHGDWHQANVSFTKPLFLFDLDTIARGARVEELARTLTHWWIEPEEIFDFYTNLIAGYQSLTVAEKKLIPHLMLAQQFRKFEEFHEHKDHDNMERVKTSIPIIRSAFGLP